MPLTDPAIRNAKPRERPYKLGDASGLQLVTPSGGKWWRLKYRFGGKAKLLSLGVYPQVSLKKARANRDEARKQLAAGVAPSAAGKDRESHARRRRQLRGRRARVAREARPALGAGARRQDHRAL